MLKPLPCPFCGMPPTVEPEDPKSEGNCWGEVLCRNEECPAIVRVRDQIDFADDLGSDAYKEDAIRHWNTRA